MTQLSHYFDYRIDPQGNRYMMVSIKGISLLRFPAANKGTAFTLEERIELDLDGLLPPLVTTLEQQVERLYISYQKQVSDISKYQFLRAIQDRSAVLFYALLEKHLEEMIPIVYTPTIGLAVQQFSSLYRTARGLTFSPQNIARAETIMQRYPLLDVRMIVVTDASAILGIGDQGMGGLSICIGKLALYTVGGGLSPFQSLPINLDVGTNREELLHDPHYLGIRQHRLDKEAYFQLVDNFVNAVQKVWPKAIIQWEDFTKDVAFEVLARYQHQLPCFNDDIQGTGAMVLAGLLAACEQKGEALAGQKIIIVGAGAGGIGVASIIRNGLLDAGLSPEQALNRLFIIDIHGLVTEKDDLEDYKQAFAQPASLYKDWEIEGEIPDLIETIRNVQAHALIGLSGCAGLFNQEVVTAMASIQSRPVIFPLSNPNTHCEAHPQDLIEWSNGKAIIATGSPFPDIQYQGKTLAVRQGNNAFIFPGLGLAAVIGECHLISDGMVLESAYALADYIKTRVDDDGIYPPISELRQVSLHVATRVLAKALSEGCANRNDLKNINLQKYVEANIWKAEYLPCRYSQEDHQ